jgi:hypothetical protein
VLTDVGEQSTARPLGESGVPMAHRNQLHPAVGLKGLDHGAQGVDVGNHGLVRPLGLAFQRGANGAPPCQLEGNPDLLQLLADRVHDPIRITGRARRSQQPEQNAAQVIAIDRQVLQAKFSDLAVCGNIRSMKRSAVGRGS